MILPEKLNCLSCPALHLRTDKQLVKIEKWERIALLSPIGSCLA